MSNQTAFQITKIGQIAIPVTNLERAVSFYRDMLGLTFLFQVPNLAFFQCGEVRLMLSPPEGDGQGLPGSVIYYQVPDLQAAYQALREREADFIDEPHLIAKMEDHDLWMVFLRDSEGNMVGLMSEVRR
jgi:methylmalonyl-CoA/ethylmalonyl-CoA epimerase